MLQFERYKERTPEYMTAKLWYQPETFNPVTMLSAHSRTGHGHT